MKPWPISATFNVFVMWLRSLAGETVGVVYAARTLIFCDLRIRTQRPRTVGLSLRVMRGDDLIGRLSLLHPRLDHVHRIESKRPFAARAMPHARRHEQPHRVRSPGCADGIHHA